MTEGEGTAALAVESRDREQVIREVKVHCPTRQVGSWAMNSVEKEIQSCLWQVLRWVRGGMYVWSWEDHWNEE